MTKTIPVTQSYSLYTINPFVYFFFFFFLKSIFFFWPLVFLVLAIFVFCGDPKLILRFLLDVIETGSEVRGGNWKGLMKVGFYSLEDFRFRCDNVWRLFRNFRSNINPNTMHDIYHYAMFIRSTERVT